LINQNNIYHFKPYFPAEFQKWTSVQLTFFGTVNNLRVDCKTAVTFIIKYLEQFTDQPLNYFHQYIVWSNCKDIQACLDLYWWQRLTLSVPLPAK
jgi:hypothetical protein